MEWILNEDRPIWLQLKEILGKMIISGHYKSGQKLPSVRELALEAGVNPNTMQRALASLDQDGLTVTNRTSGRTVTEDESIITELRKQLAKEITEKYINDMSQLGFSKENIGEFISVLKSNIDG